MFINYVECDDTAVRGRRDITKCFVSGNERSDTFGTLAVSFVSR